MVINLNLFIFFIIFLFFLSFSDNIKQRRTRRVKTLDSKIFGLHRIFGRI